MNTKTANKFEALAKAMLDAKRGKSTPYGAIVLSEGEHIVRDFEIGSRAKKKFSPTTKKSTEIAGSERATLEFTTDGGVTSWLSVAHIAYGEVLGCNPVDADYVRIIVLREKQEINNEKTDMKKFIVEFCKESAEDV